MLGHRLKRESSFGHWFRLHLVKFRHILRLGFLGPGLGLLPTVHEDWQKCQIFTEAKKFQPYIVRTWTLSLSRWSKRFIVGKQQHSTEQNIFEPACLQILVEISALAVSTIPDGLSCIKHFWSLLLTCEYCLHACLGNWSGCLLVNSLPSCGFTCRWNCPSAHRGQFIAVVFW